LVDQTTHQAYPDLRGYPAGSDAAAMHGDAAAAAMAHDGVLPETLVILVEE
jgi:hypothetical protein